MAVRPYEPGDAAAVRSLHERALRAAGTDPDDVPGVDDLGRIPEAFDAFRVCERDGAVVAMGGLVVDGRVAELKRMRVDPDHQREGHGSAVLDALERAARERGVRRLTLTTARRQTAATRFYPANGYEQVGTERYGEYELLRFEKPLK